VKSFSNNDGIIVSIKINNRKVNEFKTRINDAVICPSAVVGCFNNVPRCQEPMIVEIVERIKKVLAFEPTNLEALLTIAEAYERSGDKVNAKTSYETAKKMITMPEVVKEIDKRIEELK